MAVLIPVFLFLVLGLLGLWVAGGLATDIKELQQRIDALDKDLRG